MQQVPNAATYNLVVPSTGVGRLRLPDDAILAGKTIVGVAIRNQNSAANRATSSGNTLVSNAALAASFLSLYQNNKAVIDSVPAEYFVPDYRQGEFVATRIEQFSPSTSYITISDATRVSTGQAFEITFYYED